MKMVNRNGQGTETFPDGDKYVGGFKDGEYHGLKWSSLLLALA